MINRRFLRSLRLWLVAGLGAAAGLVGGNVLAQQAQGTTAPPPGKPASMAELLAATQPADWRAPDPENVLYLELRSGRVVIELAPPFAPRHVANIRTLVRDGYFDGLSINRSQDNFVVQWGDAEGTRTLKGALATLPPEFTTKAYGVTFNRLVDADGYAPQVGFSNGMPAARDLRVGEAWLAHCYAMVGVGRGNESDSGNGAELYVVTGHAPRQLDRNIAVVGRVVHGMERLSVLPRGTGALGFYEAPEQREPILSIAVAADVPPERRSRLELMRTDTSAFGALIELRRNRRDDWYQVPAGHIDLCNVPLPVREAPAR